MLGSINSGGRRVATRRKCTYLYRSCQSSALLGSEQTYRLMFGDRASQAKTRLWLRDLAPRKHFIGLPMSGVKGWCYLLLRMGAPINAAKAHREVIRSYTYVCRDPLAQGRRVSCQTIVSLSFCLLPTYPGCALSSPLKYTVLREVTW